MIPVVVVFAPTASGKTALAREIFGRSSLSVFKGCGEVISADSQAVYRGLDIGTAKPSPEELSDIPHHLVDVCDPGVQFGLGDFMENADRLCGEIWSRGKIPLVVGGTGFYLRNFLLGMPETPESDEKIRSQIKDRLAELGKDVLYSELKSVDPASASKINPNDEYRICRALEVFHTSGRPLSSYSLPEKLREGFRFCTIILNRPKEELYERIDRRVESMFAAGLCNEIRMLRDAGCTADSPAMKAIGYREFFDESLSSEGEVMKAIKTNSRRYAKKQYTFMRGIPGAVTVAADDKEKVLEILSGFLGDCYAERGSLSDL